VPRPIRRGQRDPALSHATEVEVRTSLAQPLRASPQVGLLRRAAPCPDALSSSDAPSLAPRVVRHRGKPQTQQSTTSGSEMRFPRCYPVFRPLNPVPGGRQAPGKPRASYFWFKRTDLLREVRELFGSKRRDHRAAEQRDELAPFHSITSSARASSVCGTVRRSALAVSRLITRSNLVGCSTGMSPGFVPRRILST